MQQTGIPSEKSANCVFMERTETPEDTIYNIDIQKKSNIFMQTTRKLVMHATTNLKEPQNSKLAIEYTNNQGKFCCGKH